MDMCKIIKMKILSRLINRKGKLSSVNINRILKISISKK